MQRITKVLLVEDDPNFGSVLKDYLELNDFEVCLAQNGREGLREFRQYEPDICILDVMMPQMDGFTLGKEIKSIDQEIPVIFLTAKSMKEDMLKGYQVGADDYLTKPFDSEVLLYKIKAVLNRSLPQEDEQEEFSIGDYRFDARNRVLNINGSERQLSPKEGALLKLLAENKNKLVGRSQALNKIWKDDNYFTGRSMDVYVAKLRKYLKEDERVAIINVHSEGFRLIEQ